MRRVVVWSVLLVVLMGVTACAVGAQDAPRPAASSAAAPAWTDRPAMREVWRLDDVRPLGQRQDADGVSVGYERGASGPFLVARSPRDGRVLWRSRAAGSLEDDLGFAVVGSGGLTFVVFLQPSGGDVELQAVDAHTGKGSTLSGDALTPPSACFDEQRVCVREQDYDTGRNLPTVRDPFRPQAQHDPLGGVRALRTDVRDVGADHVLVAYRTRGSVERIVGTDATRVRWRRSVTSVFGPTASFGYQGSLEERAGVVFGGPLIGLHEVSRTTSYRDLADLPMAGLDARTGALRWSQRGVTGQCTPAFVGLEPVGVDEPDHRAVRCAVGGRIVLRDRRYARTQHPRLAVQGFDPATGRVAWSVPVTNPKHFMGGGLTAFTGVGSIALRTADGPREVDLATGVQRPITMKDAGLGCLFSEEIRVRARSRTATVRAGQLLRRCDVDGRPLPGRPSTVLAPAVAEPSAGRWIVATPRGLVAYARR